MKKFTGIHSFKTKSEVMKYLFGKHNLNIQPNSKERDARPDPYLNCTNKETHHLAALLRLLNVFNTLNTYKFFIGKTYKFLKFGVDFSSLPLFQ